MLNCYGSPFSFEFSCVKWILLIILFFCSSTEHMSMKGKKEKLVSLFVAFPYNETDSLDQLISYLLSWLSSMLPTLEHGLTHPGETPVPSVLGVGSSAVQRGPGTYSWPSTQTGSLSPNFRRSTPVRSTPWLALLLMVRRQSAISNSQGEQRTSSDLTLVNLIGLTLCRAPDKANFPVFCGKAMNKDGMKKCLQEHFLSLHICTGRCC